MPNLILEARQVTLVYRALVHLIDRLEESDANDEAQLFIDEASDELESLAAHFNTTQPMVFPCNERSLTLICRAMAALHLALDDSELQNDSDASVTTCSEFLDDSVAEVNALVGLLDSIYNGLFPRPVSNEQAPKPQPQPVPDHKLGVDL